LSQLKGKSGGEGDGGIAQGQCPHPAVPQNQPGCRALSTDGGLGDRSDHGVGGTTMKSEWIVVANSSMARLLKRASADEPLVTVEVLQHPQSRMKASELGDDRPGHEASDFSAGGNRFEPRTDARRKEHDKFAHELAAHLERGLVAGAFGSFSLYASNPFLGELKAALSPALQKALHQAVDSDYSSLDLGELERRLRG
jgi:protein required for attachment to host cells